jgi:hypothetical protein
MNNLEIVSYIANGVLLIWAVVERILSAQDKSYIKSSIRIWQHQANGITSAINKISRSCGLISLTKFSNTKDVGIALEALGDVANSMSQSLYESRFFTDEELKQNMKKDRDKEEDKISATSIDKLRLDKK